MNEVNYFGADSFIRFGREGLYFNAIKFNMSIKVSIKLENWKNREIWSKNYRTKSMLALCREGRKPAAFFAELWAILPHRPCLLLRRHMHFLQFLVRLLSFWERIDWWAVCAVGLRCSSTSFVSEFLYSFVSIFLVVFRNNLQSIEKRNEFIKKILGKQIEQNWIF